MPAAPRPGPYDAVIFDVDGVLVDSMPFHYEAYRRALEPYGVNVQKSDVFQREGKSTPEVVRSLSQAYGRTLTDDEYKAAGEEKQRVFATFGPAPFFPGAREFVEALHARGLRTALVTGTYRRNVQRHFGDFLAAFSTSVTSDDVKHTKPHPEPYQKAMQALDVTPERTLVVENAPLGVASGKAAGARVYAVLSTVTAQDLKAADRVFPDIRELAAQVLKEVDAS